MVEIKEDNEKIVDHNVKVKNPNRILEHQVHEMVQMVDMGSIVHNDVVAVSDWQEVKPKIDDLVEVDASVEDDDPEAVRIEGNAFDLGKHKMDKALLPNDKENEQPVAQTTVVVPTSH